MDSSENHSSVTWIVVGVLAVWFAVVFLLAATGALVRPPGQAPIPIGIGVAIPLIAFLFALRFSRDFRSFVLAVDLRLAVGIQAWRFAGIAFLALYAQGSLPGFFAWPAGLGDIAIGLTAPWIVMALIQRPDFASSKLFIWWNLLGILDLVVAVTTGVISNGLAPGIVGEITTAPMALLPLVLVPVFFVPIFVMLHLTALVQVSCKSSQATMCYWLGVHEVVRAES
jgi:hypothetical protein